MHDLIEPEHIVQGSIEREVSEKVRRDASLFSVFVCDCECVSGVRFFFVSGHVSRSPKTHYIPPGSA